MLPTIRSCPRTSPHLRAQKRCSCNASRIRRCSIARSALPARWTPSAKAASSSALSRSGKKMCGAGQSERRKLVSVPVLGEPGSSAPAAVTGRRCTTGGNSAGLDGKVSVHRHSGQQFAFFDDELCHAARHCTQKQCKQGLA